MKGLHLDILAIAINLVIAVWLMMLYDGDITWSAWMVPGIADLAFIGNALALIHR